VEQYSSPFSAKNKRCKIHTYNDLEWFKETLKNKPLIEKFKKIKLILSDVDGCLTNANNHILDSAEEAKCYSVQDGFATSRTIKAGINIALITGKENKNLLVRAKQVKIPEDLVFLGVCKDKIKAVEEVQKKLNIIQEESLFFGNDLLDIETKPAVNLFVCPSNALFYIKPQADLVLPKPGGCGAFRLMLDLILYVQQKHFAQELIDKALIHLP